MKSDLSSILSSQWYSISSAEILFKCSLTTPRGMVGIGLGLDYCFNYIKPTMLSSARSLVPSYLHPLLLGVRMET